MRRKVIQIANSTQLVSLPRKWAQRYKVKKGDELEITEAGAQLIISAGDAQTPENAEVDVTGLDRTSVIQVVRGLYKRGFEEVKIISNVPTLTHYRSGDKKSFLNVVHSEVNRLPGMEIIEQKENYCVIKAISEPTLKDIDSVLRRIMLLITDSARDLIDASRDLNKVLLETIEEKHDTITKFTSYCIRLLNKQQHENHHNLHTIIYFLDKVMDEVKNTARLALRYNKKLKPESVALMESIFKTFVSYQKVHFKMDYQLVSEMSHQKEDILNKLVSMLAKTAREEVHILETFQHTLELYRGIVEIRLSMEN